MSNLTCTQTASLLPLEAPASHVKPPELFHFQKGMVSAVYGQIKANQKRILVIAPCGSGKTVMASWILRDASVKAKNPLRCVFLVDLNCLLDQAANTLRSLSVPCTVFQGNRPVDWTAGVVVASAQTIQARLKRKTLGEILGKVGLFVVDECHDLAYRSVYKNLEDDYLKTGTVFLGLTGTPWRMSRKQYLGQWYDTVVIAPQPPELIKLGRLVPCRAFGIGGVLDISQLDLGRDGDYQEAQMQAQASRKSALKSVVSEWQRLAKDLPTAAFCSGVKHAELLCQTFQEAGIAAEWQCGETSMVDRDAQNERLKLGKTKVVCSVGTMTKGWDNPAVSCILMVRATRSPALFFQAANRGARTFPGKSNYLLLDFGGNVQRHGSPTGFQKYDITEKNASPRAEAHKTCPQCSAVISVFSAICPECGHEFEKPEAVTLEDDEEIEVKLTEILGAFEKKQVKFLRSEKRRCFAENQTPDIATDRFIKEYGFIPPKEWHFAAVLSRRYSKKRKQEFLEYLDRHAKNSTWKGWHQRLEFGFGNEESIFGRQLDWWVVLSVPEDCDRGTAKAAYLELARLYHPDVCEETEAKTKMQAINNAWEAARKYFDSQPKTQTDCDNESDDKTSYAFVVGVAA